MLSAQSAAQQEFDEAYITSTEICREMAVCRATLVNRRRKGGLPDPVTVPGTKLLIWKRPILRPLLDAWKYELSLKRGSSA